MSATTVNAFTAELVIKPVPSRWLLIFILVVHLVAGGVLLLMPLALWVKGMLVAVVSGSLLYNGLLHSAGLAKRWAAVVYWRETGGWELTTATGEHVPVIFCHSSFSSVFVDVLNFKTRKALGGRRFTVILLPDNSDKAQRRCLRMRLMLRQMSAHNSTHNASH